MQEELDQNSKSKEVNCWICEKHNHVKIQITNFVEKHKNAKEILELTEVFNSLEN